MTQIITLLSTKGGSGKTLTTVFLSTALTRRGHSVEVWDADVQGSASKWAARAAEDGAPLPFEVKPMNVQTLRAGKPATDFVLIDTPPGGESVQTEAVKRADLVIMPTVPGMMDMDQMWTTLDNLGATPAIVLLNRGKERTTLLDQARDALIAEEVPLFDGEPRDLTLYSRQVYARPAELGTFAFIADELLDIMKGINQ
ncbi:ParA family protein [Rothia uropygialis]|uniref:ParA family protein n=1 Tax=Kocuria sp. 36 TaxID=1415402 RepID=UPI00101B8285|nr:ParA family protein [Kocuria sp. 36]